MKLNADIVFDNLPPQFDAHMEGPKEERLLLGRPQLYEGLEKPFKAGTLTIVRSERLPQRAYAERGAVILCIGSSPRLKRYASSCCTIQIDGSCDFYQLFNTVQGIFDAYDAWEQDLISIIEEDASLPRMLTATESLLDVDLLAIDKDFKVVGTSAHSSFSISYAGSGLPGTQNLDIDSFDKFIGQRDLSMEQRDPFLIELLGITTLNYNLHLEGEYAGCVTVQYVTRANRPSDSPVLKMLGDMILRAIRRLATLEVD
ncbi:MAG: hypothetical protein K5859_08210, partial [Atopobiaceae bacterium]|nr:hypothetical protein [Atopobiaceae bacterium]